jgi:hypothetical protein
MVYPEFAPRGWPVSGTSIEVVAGPSDGPIVMRLNVKLQDLTPRTINLRILGINGPSYLLWRFLTVSQCRHQFVQVR